MSQRRELSDDTQTRIAAHVENSAPNQMRPRLPEEIEVRLGELERRTAACYASMEEMCFRLDKLAEEIRKGPPDAGKK